MNFDTDHEFSSTSYLRIILIEIKKAYKRKALIHHPDKGGNAEKFKALSCVHSILADPTKRFSKFNQNYRIYCPNQTHFLYSNDFTGEFTTKLAKSTELNSVTRRISGINISEICFQK